MNEKIKNGKKQGKGALTLEEVEKYARRVIAVKRENMIEEAVKTADEYFEYIKAGKKTH